MAFSSVLGDGGCDTFSFTFSHVVAYAAKRFRSLSFWFSFSMPLPYISGKMRLLPSAHFLTVDIGAHILAMLALSVGM